MVPVYRHMSDPSLLKWLTKGKTQNNESLHSMIWSPCSKTVFVSHRKLQDAVARAVGSLNANAGGGEDRLRHAKLVWDLCVALWGDVTEVLMEKGVSEAHRDNYEYQDSRKTAFSRWLADATAQTTHTDLIQTKPGSLEKMFLLLAAHQVAQACECAQENDNHRLALALSQPPGANVPRQMFFKQLEDWQNCKMEPFIERDLLKVYCLQAGLMIWTTPLVDINTCEGLDWKRCLALHFWYNRQPTEGVREALAAYDAAFHGDKVYAEPPVAPYIAGEKYLGDINELEAYDMCYHLLKLYCDKCYPLHQILAPSTYTAAPLDHNLSWHLSQALYALDYKNMTAYQVGCLHTSYAAQLESLGLWHWAVFVLLHLTDSHQRECEVRQVLTRHIGLDNTEEYKLREKFLEDDLHIPPTWIHFAKAVRGRNERRYEQEAWHLQKAGLLNDSHLIILKHIAPDAIINENYNYLKQFLVGLRDTEDESNITDWKTEGAVYMDYINMMQTLNQLKEGEPSGYEVERLQAEVVSLMNRIDQIKCDTALHRLCQSEMAKRADNLMLTLFVMQHPPQPPPTRFFTQELGTLHLPEDYALQRLGQLTRSYMQELSAS
ncbi:Nuclear pore complex protein Nup98-Nup96 [Lamellibrachia satsuma]|nr:Nuclear pore complex protein Nup98-Nup96 [Lamellibrachia satsuma]